MAGKYKKRGIKAKNRKDYNHQYYLKVTKQKRRHSK